LQILLAEDSLVNQKLAVALLEEEGHSVTVAANGKEALAATRSQQFDLILMDLQMPEMDGLEATAEIREREKQTGAHVPIIAMTAHALKGDRDRCLEAGMDGYVAKPIHGEELLQAIAALVGSEKPAAQPAKTLPPRDVVDWSEALRAVRGNSRLLNEVVVLALKEIPMLTAKIREVVDEGDAAKLRLTAHTLKGTLRYFGSGPAFDHVCRLEEMGSQNRWEEVPALLSALETEAICVTDALLNHLHENQG
jgi:CheY-like chemotaxis protein/HPt (histidine-containing phosphotransfer) domain-containing protein